MKGRTLVPSMSLVLAAAVVLGGCAVADYKKPIGSLDSAISDSAKTVAALDGKLTGLRNAESRRQIVAGEALLEEDTGTCALGTGKCTLHVLFKGGRTRPYPATSVMPKARFALESLRTYVGNLAAITQADTAGEVTASANATLGSLENIASTIAKETGRQSLSGTVTAFEEPAASAIEFLVTRYVDYVKYQALAQATKRAQPVIEALAGWYATSARAAEISELSGAHAQFIDAQREFDDESRPMTGARVDAYVAAVAHYDKALQADSARPLEAFVVAHAKLEMQLNREGDISLADAATAIDRLDTEAKAFKAVVDSFQKALNERGSG